MDIPRNNKPKLLLLISITLIVTIVLVTTFTITITTTFKTSQTTHILHIHNNLQKQVAQSHCHGTLYPDLCVSTLSGLPDLHKKSMPDVICHTLNVTEVEVRASESKVSALECNGGPLSPIERRALDDCLELLDVTVDDLNAAYDGIVTDGGPARHYPDIQTTLSAAMTNQYTCLEGLEFGSNRTLQKYVQPSIVTVSRHVSNTLAMLTKTAPSPPKHGDHHHDMEAGRAGYPDWMSRKDRRLLQAVGEANGSTVQYDAVVAKDGTGNFTTIMEAVAVAANMSDTRFVI